MGRHLISSGNAECPASLPPLSLSQSVSVSNLDSDTETDASHYRARNHPFPLFAQGVEGGSFQSLSNRATDIDSDLDINFDAPRVPSQSQSLSQSVSIFSFDSDLDSDSEGGALPSTVSLSYTITPTLLRSRRHE